MDRAGPPVLFAIAGCFYPATFARYHFVHFFTCQNKGHMHFTANIFLPRNDSLFLRHVADMRHVHIAHSLCINFRHPLWPTVVCSDTLFVLQNAKTYFAVCVRFFVFSNVLLFYVSFLGCREKKHIYVDLAESPKFVYTATSWIRGNG